MEWRKRDAKVIYGDTDSLFVKHLMTHKQTRRNRQGIGVSKLTFVYRNGVRDYCSIRFHLELEFEESTSAFHANHTRGQEEES